MRIIGLTAGAALLLAGMVGCGGGGPKYVPVSGVVKVDGKPYANGVVSFQPKATAENPAPGRGSTADTDDQGRFVLKTDELKNGAVIGKHLVRIMTRGPDVRQQFGESTGTPDNTDVRVKREVIPPEWNTTSNKEFDVPPAGTDQANFDIVTKR